MNKSEIATRKEVEALKRNWESDPIYDLSDVAEEDERFKPYAEELEEYQKKMEAHWEKRFQEKEERELTEIAEEIGVPGNLKLAKAFRKERFRADKAEAVIRKIVDRFGDWQLARFESCWPNTEQ